MRPLAGHPAFTTYQSDRPNAQNVTSRAVLSEPHPLHSALGFDSSRLDDNSGWVLWQGKHKALATYGLRDFARLSWLGFLGAFLYYILLYGAFTRTSAAEAFILAYSWPILISLLAVPLLGERLTATRLLAVLISFAGVVVIVTQGRLVESGLANLPGNLLALGGAFVFAFFCVQGKRVAYDLTVAAFVYFVVALICAACASAFSGAMPLPSASVWGWLLYNGLLVNGISYLFWFQALKNGDTFVISNLLYLTPAFSLLFVRLLLSEPIHASAVLGLLLIVGGILYQSWTQFVRLASGIRSIS